MKSLFYSFDDFKKYISIFLCSAALLFASCTHGIGGEQKQTLTVATQAHAIAYAENTALYLGNPSFARTEVAYAENYLIERTQYSLSYNNATRIPNWVAWHLCSSDIGNVKRKNKFRRDPLVPRLWYRVDKNDYQHGTYGFDRGHMCPSGDRTDTAENNSATFFMTNMVPQSPANNQTVWNYFEKHIRDVVKNNSMEAYVVCGPYGAGGGSKKMTNVVEIVTDSGNAITVPSHTWKAVIYLQEGTDDISRIDEFTMVEAVFVPNDESCRGKPWESYRCSIDFIEEKTGYDLFARIPDEIEAVIEAKMN